MIVDIEKLEALAKAASQGNWNQDGFDVQNDDIEDYRVSRCKLLADAKFIAAANPAAVLELTKDLKRNQRMLLAAVCQLGEINTALGADMDSDCDELIGMIADLKSEISGLKTGYEAYERVNAELRTENERLKRNRDMWKGQVERQSEMLRLAHEAEKQLKAENARSTEREIHQLAEIEALRKDAARYQWLREPEAGNIEAVEWIGPHAASLVGDDLDSVIDAAMSKEQSHD